MDDVTYDKLKATFPAEKKTIESIYGRITHVREISYWVTIPFIKLGATPFQVSVLSMMVAICACVFIALPFECARIIGVILVPVWHVLDCVDGNIARYKKIASDYGSAVDAICGYFIDSFLPISLGIAAYNIQPMYYGISGYYFLLLGSIGSICLTLMRLIHQKYAFQALCVEVKTGKHVEKGDNQYSLKGFHKLRRTIQAECGSVGIMMFVLWLCPVFNLYYFLSAYYGIFFIISLIVSVIFYLKKCNQ